MSWGPSPIDTISDGLRSFAAGLNTCARCAARLRRRPPVSSPELGIPVPRSPPRNAGAQAFFSREASRRLAGVDAGGCCQSNGNLSPGGRSEPKPDGGLSHA